MAQLRCVSNIELIAVKLYRQTEFSRRISRVGRTRSSLLVEAAHGGPTAVRSTEKTQKIGRVVSHGIHENHFEDNFKMALLQRRESQFVVKMCNRSERRPPIFAVHNVAICSA